jgi:hypothetical protein
MNISEAVSARQRANLEIAELLKKTDIGAKYNVGAELELLAEQYPSQRVGQIITNYICPDYRNSPSVRTKEILESLFPGNPDPFFEESVTTLARIKQELA